MTEALMKSNGNFGLILYLEGLLLDKIPES